MRTDVTLCSHSAPSPRKRDRVLGRPPDAPGMDRGLVKAHAAHCTAVCTPQSVLSDRNAAHTPPVPGEETAFSRALPEKSPRGAPPSTCVPLICVPVLAFLEIQPTPRPLRANESHHYQVRMAPPILQPTQLSPLCPHSPPLKQVRSAKWRDVPQTTNNR